MKKLLSDLAKVLSMQFVVLLLIIGLFALGYYFRKDILISYHKWGQASALRSMSKHSMQTANDKFHIYSQKMQEHEKALIELGYLEERTFDMRYITAPSAQINKATEEFARRCPRSFCGFSSRGSHTITVTCQTDMMPIWEELIKKYDVPPDDPNEEK